jgi:DNA repair protein RadC
MLPLDSEAYAGVPRLLSRYGVLKNARATKKNAKAIGEFVERISRERGVSRAEISTLILLMADGHDALDFEGFCREKPRCDVCPLSEHCDYRLAPAELDAQDVPLVRLECEGEAALTAAELLSLLLVDRSDRGKDGGSEAARVNLARRLLDECGGVAGLVGMSISEIARRTKMSSETAAGVIAAIALGRRAMTEIRNERRQFRCGDDFFALYGPKLKGHTREVFLSVLLDTKNRLIRDEVVSQGTLNESLVHPREVFQAAIREGANSIALVHNHPSGDPTPSRQDRLITKQLRDVGRMVGINVLDHVIVGDGRFYSFVDAGEL